MSTVLICLSGSQSKCPHCSAAAAQAFSTACFPFEPHITFPAGLLLFARPLLKGWSDTSKHVSVDSGAIYLPKNSWEEHALCILKGPESVI